MTHIGTPAVEKMRAAGLDELAIRVFEQNIETVARGEAGYIRERDIEPLTNIDEFTGEGSVGSAIAHTAVIKLNGGLGTSMGLQAAKSLLPVTPDKTFLDIIVSQVMSVRKEHNVELPLIFMNSFRTDEDTLDYLSRYEDLATPGIPLSFIQNRVPKLRRDDLSPVEWEKNPELEWTPPGHGDLYTALPGSGMLATLIDRGFRYAMVTNSDNLGSYPDPVLAQWFADSGAPFAMEVCRREPSDRKGGHLARRISDGKIILREVAQTSPDDVDAFQDIDRHRYFNTNTLWLDLEALAVELARNNGYLGLPVIRNAKLVDPTDPTSTGVYQLETGMGSAIEIFDGSVAITVGRDRFMPVKTTNDLLLLRSDVYDIDDSGHIVKTVDKAPLVKLDPAYFAHMDQFDKRCQHIPSLAGATSLTVHGDYTFEEGTVATGDAVFGEES